MERLQGIAVSPGVAIGEVLVMDNEGFRIPRRFLPRDAVEDELERLNRAIVAATDEIERKRAKVSEQLGKEYAAIFSAHIQMLNDKGLRSKLEEMIRQRHYSPEYSVSRALRHYAKVIQSLEGVMPERANDIFDIEKRLLRHLFGKRREELAHINSEVLVLAHNLTPSETANLNPKYVRGFVTEIGGPGSHTAIVAEALGIPAVVGIGPFLADVSGGEYAIIDGFQGLVILHPDEETLARYRHEVVQHRSLAAKLEKLRDLPAETADGTRIQLLGNIEFPYEVEQCQKRGANGIGLYRTEFLFLASDKEPTEEQQVNAYTAVAQALPDRPVVIRTIDLGADKLPSIPFPEDEQNPFLGLRSDSARAEESGYFSGPVAGDFACERGRQHQRDVPADQHVVGAEAGEDGAARGPRGPRRRRSGVRQGDQGGHDGRSAVGRDYVGPVCRRGGFFQHRHERLDPVHAGGRSQQQGRGQPVYGQRPVDSADDRNGGADRGGERGADQHVRADVRQPAVHDAAVGNGTAQPERDAGRDPGDQAGMPQSVAGRLPASCQAAHCS